VVNQVLVPISKIVTSVQPDDTLVIYGLGSCVAIVMYDPRLHIGGMLHALLPESRTMPNGRIPKFVNQGIPLLLENMIELGAHRTRLLTYVIGGSQVISLPEFNSHLSIGMRNVEAAQQSLKALRLPINGQAIGGKLGRSVKLHIGSGKVTFKTIGQAEQIIKPKLTSFHTDS
jgi:chemotaxis protein CheD